MGRGGCPEWIRCFGKTGQAAHELTDCHTHEWVRPLREGGARVHGLAATAGQAKARPRGLMMMYLYDMILYQLESSLI